MTGGGWNIGTSGDGDGTRGLSARSLHWGGGDCELGGGGEVSKERTAAVWVLCMSRMVAKTECCSTN